MSDSENIGSMDIDDILDSTIDDLADYVPYEPFPLGDYQFSFGYETTTVGGDDLPAVRITLTLQEVISMAKADAVAPEIGRKVNIIYVFRFKDGEKNERSEGQFKEQIIRPLMDFFGEGKNSEILHNADGCSVIATLGISSRKDKETKEIFKSNTIKAMAVAS